MAESISSALNRIKSFGGELGKGLAIEAYIGFNKDELISKFRVALSLINPKDVPKFVKGQKALPIPTQFFASLKGLEGYLKTVSPERIFEWIEEASPDIAKALMKLGDEGALYMVQFKTFIIDSIKAVPDNTSQNLTVPADQESTTEELPPPDQGETTQVNEGDKPQAGMVRLRCTSCGEPIIVPKEEVASIKACPYCGEPT